jgi:hypothetical protein
MVTGRAATITPRNVSLIWPVPWIETLFAPMRGAHPDVAKVTMTAAEMTSEFDSIFFMMSS